MEFYLYLLVWHIQNISSGIPEYSPLIFTVKLMTHTDTDHDNDGILSIFEDIDGNDDPISADTISQWGKAELVDLDDDGDGTLTVNEDANGDGNPANDFNDPNNPTLADYLNPEIN